MNKFPLKTPVAFLIFNRSDTTKKVFEVIREVKPLQLLVVADGPRLDRMDDEEKCQAVRTIINGVDWDCEVLTNYSDVNLGCRDRISSGLDWVFNLVEDAIILEDDCVPHPTFFGFCEDLLDYYREDKRIMAISGNNFQINRKPEKYSYYFSRYNHCWGWASWRRAWQYYDNEMKLWKEVYKNSWLDSILEEPREKKYWATIFENSYCNRYDSWAYKWTFACWLQNGLTILPNVNLVSNIGFGEDATHTVNQKSRIANLPVQEMNFPLRHPPFMIRDVRADNFTQEKIFDQNLFYYVRNKLLRLSR